MKIFWNQILVVTAQLCDYTKNHFKKVTFIVCASYLNYKPHDAAYSHQIILFQLMIDELLLLNFWRWCYTQNKRSIQNKVNSGLLNVALPCSLHTNTQPHTYIHICTHVPMCTHTYILCVVFHHISNINYFFSDWLSTFFFQKKFIKQVNLYRFPLNSDVLVT